MVTYTLTAHSGLGTAAVELASVPQKDVARLRSAGAVLTDAYGHAATLEDEAVRYRPGAIVPSGVDGRFSDELAVRGLPVLLPGTRLATVAQLLADGLPSEEAGVAADALFGSGGVRMP